MATTGMGIYYPTSADPPNGPSQMQSLATTVDTLLDLPDDVVGVVSSTIAVTATSFATLPSPGPLAISITNPSSVYNMEVDVEFSAWCLAASGTAITVGVQGSGGMTWAAAAFGSGGPAANSDNIFTTSTAVQQKSGYPIIIPAGAAAVTLTMQAFRANTSSGVNCNYPTLRAKPRRFIVP